MSYRSYFAYTYIIFALQKMHPLYYTYKMYKKKYTIETFVYALQYINANHNNKRIFFARRT